VKEDIVRSLSVPWVGNTATEQLMDEFKSADAHPALAWAIGNALSIVSVKGFESQIVELCRNPRYGMARQMLVLGLGRFRTSEAEEAAVELLDDEDVKLHAIGALGKMKSKRDLFELERLLTDKLAAVRKEARKAITKIMH
jgi:HEAT repeat protein